MHLGSTTLLPVLVLVLVILLLRLLSALGDRIGGILCRGICHRADVLLLLHRRHISWCP